MKDKTRWQKLSRLKSHIIKKTWLNKKDYKFLDFDFKIKSKHTGYFHDLMFKIEIYNSGIKILTLDVEEDTSIKGEERFVFKVIYFNPQTDEDCYSIDHIIAVCSESVPKAIKLKDMGNSDILKNRFIFRKKDNYYTYAKIWTKGKIEEENYDKQLSYEFATDEYLSYVKKIFEIKKLERRKIKAHFKVFLDKIIILTKL